MGPSEVAVIAAPCTLASLVGLALKWRSCRRKRIQLAELRAGAIADVGDRARRELRR